MSKQGPDRPNYAILTNRFLSSNQWDRALEAAREWLAQDPENARAHVAAGQSLVNLERHNEAEPHLLEALKANPQNDFAWHCLSIVQFHQKRPKAADESIQKAIALNPGGAMHWHHLAWMLYKQGDSKSALKYAEKARELAPRNASILNLLTLCSPKSRNNMPQILEQYQEALALNPENAEVHNNIGVHYLNINNTAAAEVAFRRALFFKPNLKVARKNLFLVLKRRDTVYRTLCAPRDFVFRRFSVMRARPALIIFYVLALPIWVVIFEYLAALFGFWCLFIWPMVKAYEYLTIGDLRAQAGDIGAKRGGFLGYRRWSVQLRMSIFTLLLAAFWGGIAVIVVKTSLLKSENIRISVIAPLMVIGLLALLVFTVRGKLNRGRRPFRFRRKKASVDRFLQKKAGPPKIPGIKPNE